MQVLNNISTILYLAHKLNVQNLEIFKLLHQFKSSIFQNFLIENDAPRYSTLSNLLVSSYYRSHNCYKKILLVSVNTITIYIYTIGQVHIHICMFIYIFNLVDFLLQGDCKIVVTLQGRCVSIIKQGNSAVF